MIEDLIYKAWNNPDSENIQEDVEKIIDLAEEFTKTQADQIYNRIGNASDRFMPNTIEWFDRVMFAIEDVVGSGE